MDAQKRMKNMQKNETSYMGKLKWCTLRDVGRVRSELGRRETVNENLKKSISKRTCNTTP